ncbi:MAG: phosphodiester glycosidase family protein, partial [Candidatus Promineifilaceae bacterium]|nr:phosphodiester glycosidase family protein [Candidatus Promineifilaceae bacterium]
MFSTATSTAASAVALATPVATASPSPSPTPIPADSGWETLRPGLERRVLNVVDEEEGRWLENVTVLRLDSDAFRFGVAYRPGAPQDLEAWQAQTGALLLVNGGFYTEEYVATGLIISEGEVSGASYQGFGGMFAVAGAGPAVRSLREAPYDPAEPLRHALQSFPLLLAPGGRVAFPREDGAQARRTVVAQDVDGRLLFLVASRGHFTLHQLSRYLAASDLGLDVALNLDGGPSSGFLLASATADE